LHKSNHGLKEDVPTRASGGQPAQGFGDRRWDSEPTGQECNQQQPEQPTPSAQHTDDQNKDEHGQRGNKHEFAGSGSARRQLQAAVVDLWGERDDHKQADPC